MELFIWYCTKTKSCYMDLKGQFKRLLNLDKSNSLLFISKIKVNSKDDYRKAMRLKVNLGRTYNLLHENNLNW